MKGLVILKKTALIVMICTIMSQMLGFLRDMSLSYFYGTSTFSDAFLISLTIVTVLYGFVIVALSTSYIPMYREIENKHGFSDGLVYTKHLIKISLLISLVIVALVMIFAESIVGIFGQNLNIEAKQLTVNFIRIGIFNILFTGLVYIFSAFLQIRENYIVPALVGIPFNIVMIVGIVLSYTQYKYSLALAIGLSAFSQMVFLIPFARHKGFKWISKDKVDKAYIKKTITLSIPIIIGASLNDINITFSKILASNHVSGGVSAMNYSDRLIGLLYGLFISSIIAIVYPKISKEVENNDLFKIKQMVSNSLIGISVLLFPASIGYMILSEDIISNLYGRGEFDETSINLTAGLLFYMAIGMVAVGFREVFSRVFYAFKDTRTPVYNALITIIINVILSILLIDIMGINGLALSISITAYISVILMWGSLRKKIGNFVNKKALVMIAKITIISVMMGIIVWGLKLMIITNQDALGFKELLICIFLGVSVYIGGLILLNISTFDDIKGKLFKWRS